MRIGFKTSQQNVDWATLLAIWELADATPALDSGWLFDHFVSLDDGGPCFEGWTVASALAARTRRLQLGHLVMSNTYRHPAVLAKMAATLDHVAGGRFVLGIGAGWHEAEHAMYGIPLPAIGERITNLRAAMRVIRAMWDTPTDATVDAPPYRLTHATCDPPPRTPGGPPIWLGSQGLRRGLRIAAELGDGWNHTGAFETFSTKRDAILAHCAAAGRDPAEIEISAQVRLGDGGHAAALDDARRYLRAGAQHIVVIFPAADGPDGLQRLVHEVVEPLRELPG